MKNNKKGFTIVELVIVIAVIAILAAVLIPTFANLIQKTKLTADQLAVKNMNTILSADEVLNGKPADYGAMRDVLSANGISSGALTPIAENHKFFWKQSINRIILVNIEGTEATVYPEGTEYEFDADICTDLAGLPTAALRSLKDLIDSGSEEAEGKTLVVVPDRLTLDTGVNFKAAENYATAEGYATYKNYSCDFLITFNKSFDATTTVGEGQPLGDEVGFGLLGRYLGYQSGEWQMVPLFKATANEPQRIMRMLNIQLGEQEDFIWRYDWIAGIVGDFDCGIKAVYDNNFTYEGKDTFDYDHQHLTNEDKEFFDGLEIRIDLVMYEAADPDPNDTNDIVEETSTIPQVIRTYKCTYKVVGDTLTMVEG